MAILLLVLGLLSLAYWALKINFNYWRKRGVPSPPPSLLFGNLGPSMSLAKSLGQIFTDIYNDYPNLLYVGYYKIRQPAVLLRDPELIKEVLVKHFSRFHDNDIFLDEEVDPVGGRNPFIAKGSKWKVVKSQISQCFTSKKLKEMYPLLEDSVRKLINYLEKEPDVAGEAGLEARELSAKYTTEVVASCVFGLEGKSFEEADPEFRRMGKKIFSPSVYFIEVTTYFQKILHETLKYREENGVVRNDFLDFMKDLKNKPGQHDFTDIDLLAHCLGFFSDGLETSSSAIAFTLYELGDNVDVQEKLLVEIRETLQRKGGKLDYDTLLGMQYLDMVVSEALRMHPPGLALLRMCTQPFSFPPPRGAGSGPEVPIEVDTPVVIPLYGLHYDPKYFPDPERFNPDRFSDANREAITKCTYLPFGEGPRSCHGQRFGLLQTKLAVASIVDKFEVRVNKKTIVPLEIDPAYLVLHVKGGLWLNFYRRNC